jgi:hypothetical protein
MNFNSQTLTIKCLGANIQSLLFKSQCYFTFTREVEKLVPDCCLAKFVSSHSDYFGWPTAVHLLGVRDRVSRL